MRPKIAGNTKWLLDFLKTYRLYDEFEIIEFGEIGNFGKNVDLLFVDTQNDVEWKDKFFAMRMDCPMALIVLLGQEEQSCQVLSYLQHIHLRDYDELDGRFFEYLRFFSYVKRMMFLELKQSIDSQYLAQDEKIRLVMTFKNRVNSIIQYYFDEEIQKCA